MSKLGAVAISGMFPPKVNFRASSIRSSSDGHSSIPMLHRSLARSLGTTPSTTNCKTCVCSCGRRFFPNYLQPIQRRFKSRASPAVWRQRERERNPPALSRAQLEEKKLQDEDDHNWHINKLEQAIAAGVIAVDSNTAIEFLNGFAELADGVSRRRLGGSPVDMDKFQRLVKDCDLSERDCNWIAHNLLWSPKDGQKIYGKKLMYALSFAGSEMATMRVMKQALVEAKTRPAKLKASEISHMRKHLQEIAHKGENFRAMVLQGKIEYVLDNHDAAIQLWTDAMDGAVAYARELGERKARRDETLLDPSQKEITPQQDLEAPWVELSAIHVARREWPKATWAIGIGCEMDDPSVHYYAAELEKRTGVSKSGAHTTSSSWLYHITKAAASGHPKAMHELGHFYANSFWPYIDDEPPDHLKPTPFDRYPPENAVKAGDWGDLVRKFLGMSARYQKERSENMFDTAAFPYDPVGRMLMAFEWLILARNSTYAPSSLLIAELHLQKTIPSDAATPPAAIEMTDERYTFASEADYLAGRPIKDEDSKSETDEVPNPFYDRDHAYNHVRQVFYAEQALQARKEMWADVRSLQRNRGRSPLDEDDMDHITTAEEWTPQLSERARAYLMNSEARDMYCDDQAGIMFDDTGLDDTGLPTLVDVGAAAREICEQEGWDMYDHDGALMYRHGLGGNQRPAAARGGGR